MLDRLSQNFQQVFSPKGLGEKPGWTLSHRLFAIRVRSLGADEYDRHTIRGPGRLALKFETGNAGQLNVDDQTSRGMRGSRGQKLLGRTEALHRISCRF